MRLLYLIHLGVSFAKWIVALTALTSRKRHKNKGVPGADRPASPLVVAISSVKSL